MSTAEADRNLLFGILALQMDFITRDALVTAMNSWILDKAKPLAQILTEQGALEPRDRALLDPMVARHVERHGGDPAASLAAVTSSGGVRPAFEAVHDAGVQASLARLGTAFTAHDAESTATYVGPMTSTGGRFHILRLHDRGGLGEVFVARDTELNREVALKQIQDQQADDDQRRARFLLEAEITGGLEHPGIVPVYGLGHYPDGRPFYAMRFIKGDNLRHAVDHFHRADLAGHYSGARTLELRRLLGRFLDVCNAVDYAHSRGVLHRDLKPGNIMLGPYGETLVVDWGLAKAWGRADAALTGEALTPAAVGGVQPTVMGERMGTPAYMSPEQAAGRLDVLGPASDVYSLGATLYYVLTGRAPFNDSDHVEVLRKVEHGDFPPPRSINAKIDQGLDAICRKAMSLKHDDRYPSPKAMSVDLERWLADESVSALPESLGSRGRRWLRRHRTWAQAGAAALVLTTAVAASAALFINSARQDEATARHTADDQKAAAVAQTRLADASRKEADLRRLEAQSSLASAYLDRAWSLADSGRTDLGMLWTARALDVASAAGDVDLARVARANLALDRLHLSAVLRVEGFSPPRPGDPREFADYESRLPAGTSELAYGNDGQLVLAYASKDRSFGVYETATGRRGASLDPTAPMTKMWVFSPDSAKLASAAADGRVQFWDVATGRPGSKAIALGTLPDPPRGYSSSLNLRFLAGGRTLMTIETTSGRRRLWDVSTAQLLADWTPVKGQNLARPVFSADGQRIALLTDPKAARVWDASTGQPVGVPLTVENEANPAPAEKSGGSSNDGAVSALTISPDGQVLWLRRGDRTYPRRVADGKPDGRPLDIDPFTGRSYDLAFPLYRPDGKVLLGFQAVEKDRVRAVLRNTVTGEETPFDLDQKLMSAAFSPDSRLLLTGEYNCAVLRDADTGQPLNLPIEASMWAIDAEFSPDGRRLRFRFGDGFDHGRRIFDVYQASRFALGLPEANVLFGEFRPDGKEVAIGSFTKVRRWDPESGGAIGGELGITRDVTPVVAYSPDGRTLFASTAAPRPRLIDTTSGQTRGTIAKVSSHATFSPDGTLLATRDSKTVRVWDVATGRAVGPELMLAKEDTFSLPGQGLAFLADGRAIASSASDKIQVWNIPSGETTFPPLDAGKNASLVAVAVSPDGSMLVGALNRGVRIWNAKLGELITHLPISALTQTVAFTPESQRLLTGSQDSTVRFWDVATGRQMGEPLRLDSSVTRILCSPDGRSFLTLEVGLTGKPITGRARLWDMATRRPLGRPLAFSDSGRAYTAAFAPDGKSVLIGYIWPEKLSSSKSRDAVLWKLPAPIPQDFVPERVTVWVETITGRRLTSENGVEFLSEDPWRGRRDRLKALGGPPPGEPGS